MERPQGSGESLELILSHPYYTTLPIKELQIVSKSMNFSDWQKIPVISPNKGEWLYEQIHKTVVYEIY